jgi:hypothetical protein
MKTLAHGGRRPTRRPGGGPIWALAIVVALVGAVWGAWRLGVMAGDRVGWRQNLPAASSLLRKAPNPQPIPLPTQRRPGVEARRR